MNPTIRQGMAPSAKNEMRYHPLNGEWVIYATARSARPDEMRSRVGSGSPLSSHEPACPFCPGNEHLLPGIIMELGKEPADWKVRVVPNRYPALTPEGDSTVSHHGIFRAMKGVGHHEVVIESPFHDRPLGTLPPPEAEYVIEAYHRRYCELAAIPGIRTVIVFRNHGLAAGTSLVHPHSQIIATRILSHLGQVRRHQSLAHFMTANRCLLCHILEKEAVDGKRILSENDHFVSFVPYAAEAPCEIWVVPKTHRSDFGDISENEKSSFVEALQSALARLRDKLNDPDYNFVIHSAPVVDTTHALTLHWHVQIQPRLTTPAGFEMGSGIRINPSLPEADAAFLRG